MSLLVCPNCKVAMIVVPRNCVEMDVCPDCQGVWLDRGKIDRLFATGTAAPPSLLPRADSSNVPRSASVLGTFGSCRTDDDHHHGHEDDHRDRKDGHDRGHGDEHSRRGGFWNNIFD